MPTVHREDGFKVLIYPNDHLPCHVHVFKAGGEVIIQLGSDAAPSAIDQIYGDISDRQVSKALQIVQANQEKLLEAWNGIHG
ncbi:MAG TPA: DUF4160 domain-containing protein [Thermosynechococcaceae cyanobacterium]